MKSDSEVTPDVPTGAKTGQDCGHYRRRHSDKFWDICGHAVLRYAHFKSELSV